MGARSKVALVQHFNKCCVYCDKRIGGQEATKDHWIPKCEGGLNDPHNYVLACRSCNMRKGGTSGYTFILGTYLERNAGLFGRIKAMYLTDKKVHAIEAQLKQRLRELATSGHKHHKDIYNKVTNNAHQNRPPQNLQPQA